MTPSREEALFALALEKPAEKRPAFLDAVYEGDTALCACLEALLAAHEQPETLLARRPKPPALPSSSTSLTLRTSWGRSMVLAHSFARTGFVALPKFPVPPSRDGQRGRAVPVSERPGRTD